MCQPDRKQLNKCWMEPWENHNGKAENQKVLKALQDVLGGKKISILTITKDESVKLTKVTKKNLSRVIMVNKEHKMWASRLTVYSQRTWSQRTTCRELKRVIDRKEWNVIRKCVSLCQVLSPEPNKRMSEGTICCWLKSLSKTHPESQKSEPDNDCRVTSWPCISVHGRSQQAAGRCCVQSGSKLAESHAQQVTLSY